MAVTAAWSGPAGEVTAYRGMKTPKQYTLVVSEIDDLVFDAFKMSSWNPVGLLGTNSATLEAITRRNDHSEFRGSFHSILLFKGRSCQELWQGRAQTARGTRVRLGKKY
jgi:hypothetical protein